MGLAEDIWLAEKDDYDELWFTCQKCQGGGCSECDRGVILVVVPVSTERFTGRKPVRVPKPNK